MNFIHSIRFPKGILLTLTAVSAFASVCAIAATDSADSSHRLEALEKFSIDSLRYVGTLSHEDCWDGLLRTPDDLVHRVRVGSHVGQHGRVTAITKDGITISEVVADKAGGSTERTVELKSEFARSQLRRRLFML